MLFSLCNPTGNLLFKNDEVYILQIKESKLSNINRLSDLNQLPSFSVYPGLYNKNACRFPGNIVIFRNSDTTVSETTCKEIKDGIPNSTHIEELRLFNDRLEQFGSGGRVFTRLRENNGELEFADYKLNETELKMFFFEQGEKFTVGTQIKKSPKITGLLFQGFLNGIQIRVDNIEEEKFSQSMDIVRSYMSSYPKLFKDLMIFPTNQPIDDAEGAIIRVNSYPIEYMKIKQMLKYFGCTKKSGTKQDTLLNCLKVFDQENTDVKIGDKFVVEINRGGRYQSPYKQLPQDFILWLATRCKIITSEVWDDTRSKYVLEFTDKESDQFCHVLSNEFEQNKEELFLSGITEKELDSVIANVKMIEEEEEEEVNSETTKDNV